MGQHSMTLDHAHRLVQGVIARAERPHGAEREVDMAKRYALGESLDEIGKAYDLSRERVRQLINLSGSGVPDLRNARRILAAEEKKRQAERDRHRVREWSYENPGKTRQEAVETLGMPHSVVMKALGNRRNLHPAGTHREKSPKWSDEQLLEMLQEFHSQTGSTVSIEFEHWSVARGGPTRQTPTIRFGTWSAALDAAGVTGSYSVDRDRQFTDNDLWAALVEYFSFEREKYSYRAFEGWLGTRDGMPSGAHIRHRLGASWKEMSSVAQKVAASRIKDLDPEWAQDVRRQRNWEEMRPQETLPTEILRQALDAIGPVITIKSYNQWAKQEGTPAANSLMQKTGKPWSELVHEAGGRTGTRGRRDNIDKTELLQSLVEYMKTHTAIRYTEYSDWARENQRPVAQTLAHRFGSWENALSAARTFKAHETAGTV